MAGQLEDFIPVVKYEGLNSAKSGTLSGVLAFSGANTHSGAEVFSGTTSFTGASVTRRNVLASSGNTALATTQSGALVLMDSATVDFTLPAVGASDIGVFFDFKVTVTSTNQSITAAAGDLLVGQMPFLDAATPLADVFVPDGTDDLIFATNGTTTGGLINSWYRFTCISATRWFVEGINLGSGTAATPFA